ncbi:unnamed protein product [Leptosia nina]|uniref:Uncharacterized protein n=1 Tax=Leptosia nina TaxID=320188 RepID=A0AAV1J2K8_9NEOP
MDIHRRKCIDQRDVSHLSNHSSTIEVTPALAITREANRKTARVCPISVEQTIRESNRTDHTASQLPDYLCDYRATIRVEELDVFFSPLRSGTRHLCI